MFKASVTSNQLSQSIISQNWELVGLENFVYPVDGIKPGPFGSSLTKDTYTESGYRVYGQEQVIAGNLSVGDYFISQSKYLQLRIFAIRENDILLSLVGTTGKVLVIRAPFHPGIINPRLIRLRPNPETTNVHYLKHLLESSIVRYQLNQMVQGGTMEVLSATVLRRLRLPKPSLKEQYKIAEILDTIDSTIAHTSTLIAKLKQMKAGLLHDLLTRGLDENGELRNAIDRPEQFKDSPLGQIPKDWEICKLTSVCRRITDGSHQAVKTSEEGIPFLYVSCVRNGQILWDQAARISENLYMQISKGREPQLGLILYTAVGSYGHAALVQDQRAFGFQRHIAYILPDPEKVLPEYLVNWLNSAQCRVYADNVALGNAQKTVTLGELSNFPITLPNSEEQKRIVDIVEVNKQRIRKEETYLGKLKEQKKGLMHDLLTGRVRVTDLKEIPA